MKDFDLFAQSTWIDSEKKPKSESEDYDEVKKKLICSTSLETGPCS